MILSAPSYSCHLHVSRSDRDRVLAWLLKNHPKIDVRFENRPDGSLVIHAGQQDQAVLDRLSHHLSPLPMRSI